MPMYARDEATDLRVVDRFPDGVGWQAHPDEGGCRTSHAIRDDDGGVWLVDPLDAPNVTDVYADLGDVVGVAVLAEYHTRDAETFARCHDVPVTVPTGLNRVVDRLNVPTRRVAHSVADFELRRLNPLRAWRETVAYRERDGTLYVPDVLSSGESFTVGRERLAMNVLVRLSPPRAAFADVDPERVIVGHGTGVFEDAEAALADAVENARRRFPQALVSSGPRELRAMLDAVL